jgi:hypothetical protein
MLTTALNFLYFNQNNKLQEWFLTADHMARTGSDEPFIGPEPACGISGGTKRAISV